MDENIFATCHDILDETDSIEQVIKWLRSKGFSKLGSVQVVSKLKNVTIHEAVLLIHQSQTWSDIKERDEAFEELCLETLSKFSEYSTFRDE